MLFLKLCKESFLFAIGALVENKLRTFLSLLGISIGIFAIISVFTVVDSLQDNLQTSVSSLGDNVIYIQKWPWTFGPDYPWWKYMNRPLPGYTELEEVRRRTTQAKAVSFMADLPGSVIKYKDNSIENADFIGVASEYENIKSFEIAEGRYFTDNEIEFGRGICIIGADIADNLFPSRNALDEVVTAEGRKLKVIGVFKKEGKSMIGNSMDNLLIIPINYARNIIDIRKDRLNPFIMVKGKEGVSNEQLIDELRGVMRSIRKLKPKEEDNFALNETKLLTLQLDNLFRFVGIAGWIIGGFSILVGGFGIANIMFVSVKERTSIIGIQKSLGAKNYFILLQFLVEAVVLSLIGGIIGLLIVYLGSLIAGGAFDFPLKLSQGNIILGLFVSAVIGIFSGFIPALRASRMDPVEAIRSN
jgi:putative ABC transport system permease protein